MDLDAIDKENVFTQFAYNTSLIGSTDSDKLYADPTNEEMVWPEGHLRVNTARWVNSATGINDPDRTVQLEIFNGSSVQFATVKFYTPDELAEQKDAVKNAAIMKAFTASPFYDVEALNQETARYLNAMDATTYAFQAFRKSFNPEEQELFQQWKRSQKEGGPENTNFNTEETSTPRSVWELLSEATTEDLFKFKLDIFEQEVVQNSENKDLRSKIRKAKSICEVCAAYQQLLDEESTEGSEE